MLERRSPICHQKSWSEDQGSGAEGDGVVQLSEGSIWQPQAMSAIIVPFTTYWTIVHGHTLPWPAHNGAFSNTCSDIGSVGNCDRAWRNQLVRYSPSQMHVWMVRLVRYLTRDLQNMYIWTGLWWRTLSRLLASTTSEVRGNSMRTTEFILTTCSYIW